MRLPAPFDARTVDPTQSAGQLPVGRHPVIITSTEGKETKDKNGNGFLEVMLLIQDGPAKGQSGAYRLNLYNTNAQTVEIAQKQLSALCHVTGRYVIEDTNQLCGVPFYVDVEVQRKGEGAEKGYTQVVKVYDMQGNEPGKQTQQSTNAAPAGFGQQQQPQQPAQGQGGFNQPAPANNGFGQPAPANGGFGSPAPTGQAPGGFGAPAPTQQPNNGFGGGAPAPAGGGWPAGGPSAPAAGGGAPWSK